MGMTLNQYEGLGAVTKLSGMISQARGVDGGDSLSPWVVMHLVVTMAGDEPKAVISQVDYSGDVPRGELFVFGERFVYVANVEDARKVDFSNVEWSASVALVPRTHLRRIEVTAKSSANEHGLPEATLAPEARILLHYEGRDDAIDATRRNTAPGPASLLALVRSDLLGESGQSIMSH